MTKIIDENSILDAISGAEPFRHNPEGTTGSGEPNGTNGTNGNWPNPENVGTANPDMSVLRVRSPETVDASMFTSRKGKGGRFDVFGSPLTGWMHDAAAAKSAPVEYVVQSVIAAASGCIGAKRVIQARNGWQECAILWLVNIGEPSTNKSPAADPANEALGSLEMEWAAEHEKSLDEFELEKMKASSARERWEDEFNTAEKKGFPPPPMPASAREPTEPSRRRVKIVDITTQSVAEILSSNPRGLVCFRDELSAFISDFDRYSGGNGGDRGFWLEAYGARPYTVDRRKHPGQPLTIEHMAVSVFGGIQPDRLHRLVLGGDDDGFAARFLYAWPKPVRRSWQTPDYNSSFLKRLLRKLAVTEFASIELDETGSPTQHVPGILKLSEQAEDVFSHWWIDDDDQDVDPALKSAYGKGPGHVLRLSLIIELLIWAAGPEDVPEPVEVSVSSVEAALHLVQNYYRPMLHHIHERIRDSNRERKAAELANAIVKHRPPRINVRDVKRHWKGPVLRSGEDFDAAIDALVKARWLNPDHSRLGDSPGRTSKNYLIDPRVYELLEST